VPNDYGELRDEHAQSSVVSPAFGGPPSGPSAYERFTSALTDNPVSAAIGSAVSRGTGAVRSAVVSITPQSSKSAAVDPISLAHRSKPPGPELYVSVARIRERAGDIEQAAAQYQKALDLDSGHLDALVGYAHLEDRRGRFDEAIRLYQQAVKQYPDQPVVRNDLGLCYARAGRVEDASVELAQAVALKPEKPLYRNNLARVLTELGRFDEALEHLSEVHPPAVAHYNLGHLLQERGQIELAGHHFRTALQLDPQLSHARGWLAKLGQSNADQPAPLPSISVPDSDGMPSLQGPMAPGRQAMVPPHIDSPVYRATAAPPDISPGPLPSRPAFAPSSTPQ
jgi:Flp pilus assembly protein TadD